MLAILLAIVGLFAGFGIAMLVVKQRQGSSEEKAKKELDFVAMYTLEDMCRDSWNFQKTNFKTTDSSHDAK